MMVRKYQFMETNKQRAAVGHREKIPDIQKTLDMVQFLKTRKVYRLSAAGEMSTDGHNSLVPTQWRQLSS